MLQPVDDCVKVNMTEPLEIPVTTPAFVTVAIELSLLVQVPPVTGDKTNVLPVHKDAGAITTGNGLIVTAEAEVLIHPFAPVNE